MMRLSWSERLVFLLTLPSICPEASLIRVIFIKSWRKTKFGYRIRLPRHLGSCRNNRVPNTVIVLLTT